MRKIAALAVLAVLASGCMSFNGKELRRPEVEKPPERYAVVELEVAKFDKLMNGKFEGLGANFNEGSTGRSTLSQIARMWKAAGLIEEWGFPGDLDEGEATHRLVISGTLDETGSLFSAVLTGLSLYLIPSSFTMTTDVDVTLIRLADDHEFATNSRNSFTTWQHLIFLPTSLLGSMAWGVYGSQKDLALYLYDEFKRAGAFEQ